jgi:hypothetical protein
MNAGLDDIAHHAGLGVGTAYRHFAMPTFNQSVRLEIAHSA